MDKKTDREMDEQKDKRHTDRQTVMWKDKQMDRLTDRQSYK